MMCKNDQITEEMDARCVYLSIEWIRKSAELSGEWLYNYSFKLKLRAKHHSSLDMKINLFGSNNSIYKINKLVVKQKNVTSTNQVPFI